MYVYRASKTFSTYQQYHAKRFNNVINAQTSKNVTQNQDQEKENQQDTEVREQLDLNLSHDSNYHQQSLHYHCCFV